jgi:hypothetical protein
VEPASDAQAPPVPDLDGALAAWRRRIARRRRLTVALRALLCALLVATVLALLARVADLPWPIVVAVPAALFLVVLGWAWRGPDLGATARLLDHDLDLDARLVTARQIERTTAPAARSVLETAVVDDARAQLARTTGARVRRPDGASRPGDRGRARVRGRGDRRAASVVAVGVVVLVALVLVGRGADSAVPLVERADSGSGGATGAAATVTRGDVASTPARTVQGTSTVAGQMTPAERRTAPTGLAPGANLRANRARQFADTQRAALRGGRTRAGRNATQPPSAPTTDRAAVTQGNDRGLTPVHQPTGLHRQGTPGFGTKPGAPGEGAAPLAAKANAKTGTHGAAGTPGQNPDQNNAKQNGGGAPTTRGGNPTPAAQNRAASEGAAETGRAGNGTAVGNARGRDTTAAKPGAQLRTPSALPLAAGFRPGGTTTGKTSGRPGAGEGNGKGKGRSESGTAGAAAGDANAGALGFVFPDARSAPGLRTLLLLHYFGA